MNKQPKLDTETLLTLALQRLKTTRKKWEAQCAKSVNLSTATYLRTDRKTFKSICPTTGEPRYRDELVYETRTHFIKTTQHGRVIDIETKPQSIINKPRVIVKKKRTYTK